MRYGATSGTFTGHASSAAIRLTAPFCIDVVHNRLVLDRSSLESLDVPERDLSADECAEVARRTAALVDAAALERNGDGFFELLWRSAHSEAWLNCWWDSRDTGFHDHGGSCVGVLVVDGRARNEALVVSGPRRVREYGAGDSFSFPGTGIHRMEHDAGAVTIHVYSPPIETIGHYELVDGELRRHPGPPDEGSPPSPALTASLLDDG
jgi:hypothetical protein